VLSNDLVPKITGKSRVFLQNPSRAHDKRPEGLLMSKRVTVFSQERILDGFFKIDRAVVSYERFDGTMSAPMTRLVFERGDSVAVLLFDRQRREVVLVQQFRYPAYVRDGDGWLWEIIAGTQEEGRSPEEVVRAEALEEAGYHLDALHHVATVYPSPGGTSERMHIFLAPVSAAQRVGRGGGLAESGEDILVRTFSLEEALRMVEDGRIADAKTVLALQYLALHEQELGFSGQPSAISGQQAGN